MRLTPELVLVGGQGRPERSFAIGTRHLSVGRGPDNDLMIPAPEISRHHLIVWATGAAVFLQDLGSANGTFLADQRVVDVVRVPPGTRIRLGKHFELMVRAAPKGDAPGFQGGLALEDVASGLSRPLHRTRFLIGSGQDADLRLNQGPACAATLMVDPEGEVWLSRDEDDRVLALGESFEVSGAHFRVVEIDPTRMPTIQPEGAEPVYRLRVDLDGPGGATATVENLVGGGAAHHVGAENRVVLLYLLARKIIEDRAAGMDPQDEGWCEDADVIVGIWGRTAQESGANRLKVLVHRVRKELAGSGFLPGCIEKRSGLIRGRFVEVEQG